MYLLVRVAVACVLFSAHITASFDERYAQPHTDWVVDVSSFQSSPHALVTNAQSDDLKCSADWLIAATVMINGIVCLSLSFSLCLAVWF